MNTFILGKEILSPFPTDILHELPEILIPIEKHVIAVLVIDTIGYFQSRNLVSMRGVASNDEVVFLTFCGYWITSDLG